MQRFYYSATKNVLFVTITARVKQWKFSISCQYIPRPPHTVICAIWYVFPLYCYCELLSLCQERLLRWMLKFAHRLNTFGSTFLFTLFHANKQHLLLFLRNVTIALKLKHTYKRSELKEIDSRQQSCQSDDCDVIWTASILFFFQNRLNVFWIGRNLQMAHFMIERLRSY